MGKYLDQTGLAHLWGELKRLLGGKVNAESGKQLSTNDYSNGEKNKLAGLANYVHPAGDGNGHVPATGAGSNGKFLRAGTTAGSAAWNVLDKEDVTTALGYTPPTTDTKYTHPGYTAKAAGLYKVTVDASGHVSGAAAATKADITGLGIPGQDTSYGVATASADGLMQKADKAKLDGVEMNANSYTHPVYTAKAAGLYKVAVDASGHVSTATAATKADITGLGIPGQDTSYGVATASADGLLPKADKAKLDGFGAAGSYALKADISGVYKYKGSVTAIASLPASGAAGDVYNVETDGMNYAWNGTAWDPLGGTLTIDSITNAEIDTILAS